MPELPRKGEYRSSAQRTQLQSEEAGVIYRACLRFYDARLPQRKRMSFDNAVAQIKKGAGKKYDPEVVKAFLKLVESGDLTDSTA